MRKISFTINTSVNTLEHVKLLLRSLKENLKGEEHQILVFVDSDNERTEEYLKSVKSDFHDLTIITHDLKPCVGYSRNTNLMVEHAKHDIVSYLQSDMVICKNYDELILEELEENCILSATRIEPSLHGNSPVTITKDFGLIPNDFNMTEFIKFSESEKSDKDTPFFFAPFTFHKDTWLKVGGYDTLFRRSREDTDFLMRSLKSGTKIKQTFKANVYHFTCVASRGKNWFDQTNIDAQGRVEVQNIADQIELGRFFRKWGNFSHGEYDLIKYDIDFVYDKEISSQEELTTILNIEPFVSRVWLTCQEDVDKLTSVHNNDHMVANQLLNFSNDDWDRSKKFYNQPNFEEIFRVGTPEDYNVKLTVTNIENIPVLIGIHQTLYAADIGVYEMGPYHIDIKSKVDVTEERIVVENPEFDRNLLFIN